MNPSEANIVPVKAVGDNGMIEMQHPRAAKYRDTAETLRRLAGRLHFDFGRRAELMVLADEFDRLADYVEGGPSYNRPATE